MGLRETINQRPSLITGVTVGMMVVALAVIVYQQRSNRAPDLAPGERPVYIPPAEDRPVDAPADPRGKGTTTPARPPGRAAAPRPRKILVDANTAAAVAAPTPDRISTTETLA